MPRPKSSKTRKIERLTAQNKQMADMLRQQNREQHPIVQELEQLEQADTFILSFIELSLSQKHFIEAASIFEDALQQTLTHSPTLDSQAVSQLISDFFSDCRAIRRFYDSIKNHNKPQTHDTIRI